MPDRLDVKPGQTITQHTLEKAWWAIYQSSFTEDGLEPQDAEYVLSLIVDALGYDPGPKECGACKKPFNDCDGH